MRAALLLALVALAGCGSSDDDGTARFEEDGFGITFEYPAEMDEAKKVTIASGAGSAARATAGVGFSKNDVIIVQRYDLKRAIDDDNLPGLKAEFDRLVAQLSSTEATGLLGKTAGFPSIDYSGLAVNGAETRLIALFDGDVEYLVNCQSTRKGRADIAKACKQVLDTVKKK